MNASTQNYDMIKPQSIGLLELAPAHFYERIAPTLDCAKNLSVMPINGLFGREVGCMNRSISFCGTAAA
jgi:hypothetical protein